MSVAESRRVALFEALAGAIGREAAVTLFEVLPPSGDDLATRSDVAVLRADVDVLRSDVDVLRSEVGGLRSEVGGLRREMDVRFDALDDRLDDRFAATHAEIAATRAELLAAFRGELVTAVSGQTRALIVAVAGAVFGIGGLAVTLAQVL